MCCSLNTHVTRPQGHEQRQIYRSGPQRDSDRHRVSKHSSPEERELDHTHDCSHPARTSENRDAAGTAARNFAPTDLQNLPSAAAASRLIPAVLGTPVLWTGPTFMLTGSTATNTVHRSMLATAASGRQTCSLWDGGPQ